MRKRTLFIALALLLVGSLLLSACGSDTTNNTSTENTTTDTTTEDTGTTEDTTTEDTTGEINPNSVLLVTGASGSGATFTAMFNPFNAQPLFPTLNGIYEPLMMYNKLSGEILPWLATDYAWSDDLLSLTFTIREGVKWSDGEDFTADDVAYTFNTLAGNPALTGVASALVGENGYVSSVEATDATTVVFNFKEVYSPAYYTIIKQDIFPEHIFSQVDDLTIWANEDPVGTGPFTEVVLFQDQVYQVDRNPNYWQPGLPAFQGLRMPAFTGNDVAATMFVNGDTEWTGQFFPNVQQAVLDQNSDLSCYWPTITSDQLFMPNNAVAPLDDPIVRKAISMGFDREQIILIALQGASSPSDVTGLSSGYSAWKVADVASLGDDWTAYDPDTANQMLDDAGYVLGDDGIRLNKDGSPIELELLMVNGFTDWLAVAPLMKQNLEALGFSITINNYDVPVAFGKWWSGDFDLSLFFGIASDTPYEFYYDIFSSGLYKPVGENTGMSQNMWRYDGEQQAAADAALQKFASTGDVEVQKEAILELQQIMHDEAPVLGMFHAPTFSCFSNARFAGWPSDDNPSGWPMPIAGANTEPSQILTVLSLSYSGE